MEFNGDTIRVTRRRICDCELALACGSGKRANFKRTHESTSHRHVYRLSHSLSDTHTFYTRYNPKVNKGL